MPTPTTLPWQDPLALVPLLDQFEHAALLYSGAEDNTSYLCLNAQATCTGSDLAKLQQVISTNQSWHENLWVGWLGYGLKNQLEQLPEDTPSHIQTEDYVFFKPNTIYCFDHTHQQVECIGPHTLEDNWHIPPTQHRVSTPITQFTSNMTKAAYINHVETILEAIRAGTLYQANLTRKFFGEFASAPNPADLFTALCKASPASHSAFIRMEDTYVLCSSPECFLRIEPNGTIASRPIKGTIGRSHKPAEDATLKQALATSAKDQSENLMIVDLMRNDLSRVCTPGSVSVDALFDITTHAHIHHMSSLITGKLQPNTHPVDAVAACFPPGSMTGAPKIKAMELCSQLEQQTRGIYSGALGWFGGDGSAHLSVIIRTLILQHNRFEFQVGGGIVADSIPEKEYEETLDKAKGICKALAISDENIRKL